MLLVQSSPYGTKTSGPAEHRVWEAGEIFLLVGCWGNGERCPSYFCPLIFGIPGSWLGEKQNHVVNADSERS